MGKVLLGIVIGVFLLYAYQRVHEPAPGTPEEIAAAESGFVEQAASSEVESTREASGFRCDGRTRCPQMNSCAEAMYFLEHCPNVEMDGDNDGLPCEGQWCGR